MRTVNDELYGTSEMAAIEVMSLTARQYRMTLSNWLKYFSLGLAFGVPSFGLAYLFWGHWSGSGTLVRKFMVASSILLFGSYSLFALTIILLPPSIQLSETELRVFRGPFLTRDVFWGDVKSIKLVAGYRGSNASFIKIIYQTNGKNRCTSVADSFSISQLACLRLLTSYWQQACPEKTIPDVES
jgi:hypothetical protein